MKPKTCELPCGKSLAMGRRAGEWGVTGQALGVSSSASRVNRGLPRPPPVPAPLSLSWTLPCPKMAVPWGKQPDR